jgi:hypothetical protein
MLFDTHKLVDGDIRFLRRLSVLLAALRKLFQVIPDYIKLERARAPKRFKMSLGHLHLCLWDATKTAGFDRHYIYHTAWAARLLAKTKPRVHIDISSSLYFNAISSAFVPIRFLDYRPAALELSGLTCEHANLMSLPFSSGSVESLSCMHVVEHVGLGRYGDPIDYTGDLKAASELSRILRSKGQLFFVVPIGSEAIIKFNAHRIYTPDQVRDMFPQMILQEFAIVPDHQHDGGLVVNPAKDLLLRQRYACGCFWFIKT